MVWVPWVMADNGRRGMSMDESTPEGAWASTHEPPSVYASRLRREEDAAKKAADTPTTAAPKQVVYEYPKDGQGNDCVPTVSGVQSSFARSQSHYDQSRVLPGVPTMLERNSGRASNADRPTSLGSPALMPAGLNITRPISSRCVSCTVRGATAVSWFSAL